MTAASLKKIVEEALAEVGATVNFKLVPKGKARTTTWLGVEHGFGIRHYPSVETSTLCRPAWQVVCAR